MSPSKNSVGNIFFCRGEGVDVDHASFLHQQELTEELLPKEYLRFPIKLFIYRALAPGMCNYQVDVGTGVSLVVES